MMMQKKQPSAPQDSKRQPREETHLEGLASTTSMLIIWSFVMGFVLQNFVIPSSSMASTLLVGDHVIVERATLAPASSWTNLIPYRELRRDEPVFFFRPAPNPEGQHDILVKRVIGIPGDRIHLRDGIVYRNGVSLDEPYAAKPTPVNYDPYNDEFPAISPVKGRGVTAEWSLDLLAHIQGEDLVVPPGMYFVMGDNRTNSYDGRYWVLPLAPQHGDQVPHPRGEVLVDVLKHLRQSFPQPNRDLGEHDAPLQQNRTHLRK